MTLPSTRRQRATPIRIPRHPPRWRRRSRRGVSDVVATILILGLTVTLFASIFAFVGSFPSPTPQNVNEFQASIIRTANNSYISGLTIEHLAGPAVPGSDHVYLETAVNKPNWQFSISGGIPVYWGLTGNSSTSSWSFGQYWTTTFTKLIHIPDNITVYVVTPNQLLYSVVLPGLVITTPPAILAYGITPSSVGIGQTFQFWASLGGTLTGGTVKINIASIPGLSGNQTMTLGGNGLWTYTVASGATTTSGTYYGFLYATNSLGGIASTSIAVKISTTVVTPPTQLTVTVGMSPQPPTLPQETPAAYFWATVTYTGSKTASLYVNFTISQLAGGRSTVKNVLNTIPGTGSTPVSMTGPSSMTVFSQVASNFNTWLLNSSVVISAPTVLVGVGSATGSTAFSTQNLVRGFVQVTSSGTGALGSKVATFSHSCVVSGGGANCPYVFVTVYDNFTTALGGPATVTFSGIMWANTSSGTVHDYELPGTGIASTSVTQGASTLVNLNGASTRWGGMAAGTYILHLWLTIKSSAAGTPIIGYIYDTYHVTIT
ncbi:MAG: type IV pilin N-terminal domain-containing protein [Thermoplasmata archaeon]